MATATLHGFQELVDHVDMLQSRLANADWTPLLRSMQKHLEDRHDEFFQHGVGPDGVEWPANKQSTIDRKGHGIVLIDKGDLLQSLTTGDHPDAIRYIYDEGQRFGLSFGTRRPYSHFHQYGTKRLPIRMHVGANQSIVDELKLQLRDFAIGLLAGGQLI